MFGTPEVPVLFLLAFAACDSEPQACDTMAVYSVTVTVDTPAEDVVSVTYAVDGEDKGDCDAMPDGTWACGVELAGHFVITATVRGYDTPPEEVDVGQGECHVVPEAVTIEPHDCESAGLPAVVVNLSASDGTALFDPEVLWALNGGDDASCNYFGDLDGGGTQWTCGIGDVGTYVVTGIATGYGPATRSTEVVASDFGCGVETQTVDLVLEPDAVR